MEDASRDIRRIAQTRDDAEAGSLYETIRARVEPLDRAATPDHR